MLSAKEVILNSIRTLGLKVLPKGARLILLCLLCGNALMAQKSIPKNYQKKYTKHLRPWMESQ